MCPSKARTWISNVVVFLCPVSSVKICSVDNVGVDDHHYLNFLFIIKDSPPVFSEVRVARSLVFCVVFCTSLLVLFLLVIVLSTLLRFTNYDYPFGIFKLFLLINKQNTTFQVYKLSYYLGIQIIKWKQKYYTVGTDIVRNRHS